MDTESISRAANLDSRILAAVDGSAGSCQVVA